MITRESSQRRRPGAMTVEFAIVLPVLVIALFGIIVGGLGVFRYQIVACQAQEAARFACVRGADYQLDANQSPTTTSSLLNQVVIPLAIGMDVTQLSMQVQWIDNGSNTIQNWDSSPQYVKSVTTQGQYITNSVRVTVTYTWIPECFLGSCQLQSVCEMPMSN